jgi:hypothetical protein
MPLADMVRPRAHPPPDATCAVVALSGYEGNVDSMGVNHYDSLGRLRFGAGDYEADGITDSIGIRSYDSHGRLVETAGDEGWDGVYDSGWRLTYDEAGRLVEEAYDDEWDGVANLVVTYVYNERGWVVKKLVDKDGDGVIDDATYLHHDAEGNEVLAEWDSDGDGVIDYLITFDYVGGLLVRQEIDVSADGTVDRIILFTYDEAGRLISIERDGDANGEPEGSDRMYYNERGWLVRYEIYFGRHLHMWYLYVRDELDRITEMRNVHQGLPTGVRRYSYSEHCVPTVGRERLPAEMPPQEPAAGATGGWPGGRPYGGVQERRGWAGESEGVRVHLMMAGHAVPLQTAQTYFAP